MSTSARYTHLSLPSSDHIRLLEFPAYTDQSEPLQAIIRVVDLEESTFPYVALSYTWGMPTFTEALLLDGGAIFGITPTVAAALRYFRYSSALRWIWVDAICINQEDDAEKTMQIPLMGNIYRGASRVLVWLGDRAEDINLVCQIKRLLGRITGTYDDVDTADRLVIGLSQLSRLPWFSRRWIIQELVLNPNAVLCCGQTEIPWTHLAPAFQIIDDKERTDLQNIRLLWEVWKDISMPVGMRNDDPGHGCLEKRGIAALMHLCSAFECLDGHDRIAALIGLSTDARRRVTVNYADTVEQTFITFAEGLARTGHMTWLIYQSLQRKKHPNIQGQTLPSWVPDWRTAISIHDPNSKLDNEVYKRVSCNIKMYSASPSLHLLTAKFLTLVEQAGVSTDALQPVSVSPAQWQVAWKSALFPKKAGLAERLALTLVDLWPWVMAHLSEHEMTSRRDIWFELLIWLSFSLGYLSKLTDQQFFFVINDDGLVIPDFNPDANDLNALRSFARLWTRALRRWTAREERSKEDLARIDCLIFCRQNSQSGILSRGQPFTIGSLQLPFYHTIKVGDKVLSASLGHFHFASYDGNTAQHDTRHIVREHAAVDGLPVLSGFKSPDALRRASECAPRAELLGAPEAHGSQEMPLPAVYEFVAPCDIFGHFSWRGLHTSGNGKLGVWSKLIRTEFGVVFFHDPRVETDMKTLSVWIK